MQYERDGAVVIESRALRALNAIGRDEVKNNSVFFFFLLTFAQFLRCMVPLCARLCVAISSNEFASACVTMVLCKEDLYEWEPEWKVKKKKGNEFFISTSNFLVQGLF